MPAIPPPWAFIGLFAGPWKLAIVVAAVGLLYGRAIRPRLERFLSLRGHATARPTPVRRPVLEGRLYLLLVVVAATAVATWIVTKMLVTMNAHPPH